MVNVVRYLDQTWGEPIAGERLSTNGYYTGEHKGAPMQDAKTGNYSSPHGVEAITYHLGTITQDAIADSMPEENQELLGG